MLAAFSRPPIDWFALSPVLALLGASGLALLAAVLVPAAQRRLVAATLAGLGYVGAILASIWLYVDSPRGHLVVGTAFYRDRWTALAAVIVAAVGLAAVGVSWAQRLSERHVAEYYFLLAAAGAG